jgi:hypothetical protein
MSVESSFVLPASVRREPSPAVAAKDRPAIEDIFTVFTGTYERTAIILHAHNGPPRRVADLYTDDLREY